MYLSFPLQGSAFRTKPTFLAPVETRSVDALPRDLFGLRVCEQANVALLKGSSSRQGSARRRLRLPPSGLSRSRRRVLRPRHGPADKLGAYDPAAATSARATRTPPRPMARPTSRVDWLP